MALGDMTYVGNSNSCRTICLMTGQTANTGQPADAVIAMGAAPTAGTGVPNYPNLRAAGDSDIGACFAGLSADFSTLVISSTAGSATMAGTFTLWGYLAASGKWYPVKVNGGTALAELAVPGDTIRYAERFQNLGHFDRLYLELAAVGGTATAFEAFLTTARQGQ